MAIERVLNGVKHVHRFTRAVSVGNPREFLQAEKQEQEMAEACQHLADWESERRACNDLLRLLAAN